MAQMALTFAGGAAGSAIGGPIGGIIGSMIGSMVGAAIDNLIFGGGPSTPRASDKRFQTSTYGNDIVRGYGTYVATGNIIWSTEFIAHEVDQSSGGGDICGGGGDSTTPSVTYTVSFAVSVCEAETPIGAFLRIWADEKLIWDARQVADGPSNHEGAFFHFYKGGSSQLPSPIIQEHMGVEITPAFRDQAYVVIQHLSLVNFADHMPNIKVEVAMSGTAAYPVIDTGTSAFDPEDYGPFQDTSRNVLFNYNVTNGSWQKIGMNDGSVLVEVDSGLPVPLGGEVAIGRDGNLYTISDTSSFVRIFQIDSNSLQVTSVLGSAGASQLPNNIMHPASITSRDGYIFVWGRPDFLGITNGFAILDEGDANPLLVAQGISNYRFVGKYGRYATSEVSGVFYGGDFDSHGNLWTVYQSGGMGGDLHLAKILVNDLGLMGGSDSGDGPVGFNPITLQEDFDIHTDFATTVTTPAMMYLPDQDAMLICNGPAVILFDMVTETVTQTEFTLPTDAGAARTWATGPLDGNLYGGGAGSNDLWRFDPAAWDVDTTWAVTPFSNSVGAPGPLYEPRSNAYWGNSGGLKKFLLDRVGANDATLSDIVGDICTQAGLTSGQYDASALTDAVHGYMITRSGPLTEALAPLATAYFFDAVESDYKIKFVKQGATPTLTIPIEDMAAHASTDKRPDVLVTDWEDTKTLPDRVQLKYLNPGRLYQDDLAEAKRFQFISDAKDAHPIELALVLTSSEAITKATQRLGVIWTNRRMVTFYLTRKYLYLDPLDVVKLGAFDPTFETTRTIKITQIDYGANGVLKVTGVSDDPDAYTQPVIPGSYGFGQIGVGGSGSLPETPSLFFLLDIPALRDQDNDAGFYVAAGPVFDGGKWTGCTVQRSTDGGTDFSKLVSFVAGSDEGYCRNTLGTPRSWGEWDMDNTVVVAMNNGDADLVSKSQLAVLNGANQALVGNEIISFTTVTPTGDGTFTLSGLMRGRRGSDTSIVHSAGERFTMLSTGQIKDHVDDSSQIGVVSQYRTTAAQGVLSNPTNFANSAKRLWPYSVQDVTGARDMSDNLTIAWIRRTRIHGEVSWNNAITEVPVSEVTESYSIDILDGSGNVVRTLTSSSPSVVYSAADQVTDFGLAQASVPVIIYQLSAIVGRGFPSPATV